MIRRVILVLIVVTGLAAIGTLFVGRLRYSHQDIKSCFDDAGGLKSGAAVRISGVDVGTVRSVRVTPQKKSCPAEVEIAVATTYELRIPKDSIAQINSAGVLGGVYVSIDTRQTSDSPIENYGYLKSKPSQPEPSLADYIRAMEWMVKLNQASRSSAKETPENDRPSSNKRSR